MILRRLGNKAKIAQKIQEYFPAHDCYVEPFFGAGGMFFNKPQAKYNIVNDIDSDVFNLFTVLRTSEPQLRTAIELMPIHQDLLRYWKTTDETDPVYRAARFLFLSNFTFMGKMNTLKFEDMSNAKKILLYNITPTLEKIRHVQFLNCDFRKFLKSFQISNPQTTFIYCDPPYVGTADNYSDSFTLQDTADLFDCLNATGCKFAVSEFANADVIELAKIRKLNVIVIGERRSIANRSTEILITNYESYPTLF